MKSLLTAQEIFNGEGFDAAHMLRKAKRELARLRIAGDLETAYDHMFNFAVTLAAVSDWTFHLALSQQPAWNGKREQHFTNWVRYNNSDAFVFIDISNEYKHANRNKNSSLARKMMLKAVWTKQNPAFVFDARKMLRWSTSSGDLIAIPWIERADAGNDFFVDIAERALAWWDAVDVSTAGPMDGNGNTV